MCVEPTDNKRNYKIIKYENEILWEHDVENTEKKHLAIAEKN